MKSRARCRFLGYEQRGTESSNYREILQTRQLDLAFRDGASVVLLALQRRLSAKYSTEIFRRKKNCLSVHCGEIHIVLLSIFVCFSSFYFFYFTFRNTVQYSALLGGSSGNSAWAHIL